MSRPAGGGPGHAALGAIAWWGPPLVTLVFVLICSFPSTRPLAWTLDMENGPVEMTTFIAFIGGGVLALVAARRVRQLGLEPGARWLLTIFGAGWLFAGMEEVSWGQSFLNFASPAGWQRFNAQDEINLHNLAPVQSYHSLMLFVIAVAGILFVLFTDRWMPVLRFPGPARMCLAITSIVSTLDLITDHVSFGQGPDFVIGMLQEVNEMVLALGGLMFGIAVVARLGERMRTERSAASADSTMEGGRT